MKRTTLAGVVAATLAAWLTACSDTTGPGSSVALRFATVSPLGSAAASRSPAPSFGVLGEAARQLTLTGTNGSLEITAIRLIVDEFELEPVEVADCDDVDPKPASCADFEVGMFFVDVPLDGQAVTVTNQDIPVGLYDELEFEVEDGEIDTDDEDDAGDAERIQELLAEIRVDFPDWPEGASMVVEGSFTPTGGTAVDFRTYFEAEIEVELDLDPPLEITDATRSVMVELNPAAWFMAPDGSVTDLSAFDFPTTGTLVEFELELEDGLEVEIDS
jgi:hypothetical protein